MRDDIPTGTLLMALSNGLQGKRADRVPRLVASNPVLYKRVGEILADGCELEGWLLIGELYRQATAIIASDVAQKAIQDVLSKEFKHG